MIHTNYALHCIAMKHILGCCFFWCVVPWHTRIHVNPARVSTSVSLHCYPGSSEGVSDSAILSEAYSISAEYVQTFEYHHKKPGDPDSGIGKTTTRTGPPTITSHLTEVNLLYMLVHTSSIFDRHRLTSTLMIMSC